MADEYQIARKLDGGVWRTELDIDDVGGGGGGTQDLGSVLAEGNDAGGVGIENLANPIGNSDADTKGARDIAIAAEIMGLASVYFALSNLDTDGTLAANSDAKVASQKAVRTYVAAQVAALVASAPGALDTLDELAAALGDDSNFAATVTTALAGKQPLDSDLTAIAALATTSYGRGLLELANAAALRTTAGLVIGTDVEAHDADLTTIAGLAPANDDLLQRKAGAWTNRTIAQLLTDLAAAGTTFQPLDSDLTALAALTTTAFGRSLLEQANAAALRSAAGLAPLVEDVNDVGDAGDAETIADVDVATIHLYTLTEDCTFTFPTAEAGKSFTVVLTQDATGGWEVTWPATVKWPDSQIPEVTITAGKRDLFRFVCIDGSNWVGIVLGQNYSSGVAFGEFGQTIVGTQITYSGGDYTSAIGPHTLPVDAWVTDLEIYLIPNGSVTKTLRPLIYRVSDLALVAEGPDIAPNVTVPGWYSLPLTAPTFLLADDYYLAYGVAPGATYDWAEVYEATSTNRYHYFADTFAGGPEDPMAIEGTQDLDISIKANYFYDA